MGGAAAQVSWEVLRFAQDDEGRVGETRVLDNESAASQKRAGVKGERGS